ncbi:hypothetical protein TrVE_jg7476 [Triparma verrucosa]|uniref:Uncharacterized protein n=1 Tax=Triparma verrucosa TaxID=1606542 RepID=A0A9W7CGU5_9STRA|nr:hypothetical protein TrVE_jg7476 [Triparma verrucosa]
MAYEVGTNGTWAFVCDLAPEDAEYDSRHTGCQFPYVNKDDPTLWEDGDCSLAYSQTEGFKSYDLKCTIFVIVGIIPFFICLSFLKNSYDTKKKNNKNTK